MAFYRLTSTQELCQRFTRTAYDGVDYNEHRANVHLSPRGAQWKSFSARYIIPPLAFSVHCINISVNSPCIVLTLNPGLTITEILLAVLLGQVNYSSGTNQPTDVPKSESGCQCQQKLSNSIHPHTFQAYLLTWQTQGGHTN